MSTILPLELLQCIFEELQSAYNTRRAPLARCARVSRAWYALVYPLLYRQLSISDSNLEAREPILRTLEARPAYFNLIHELAFFSDSTPSWSQQVTAVLRATLNLRRLELHGVKGIFSTSFAEAILALRRLEDFEIGYMHDLDDSEYSAILDLIVRRAAGLRKMNVGMADGYRLRLRPASEPIAPDQNRLSMVSPTSSLADFAQSLRNEGWGAAEAGIEYQYHHPELVSMLATGLFTMCERLDFTEQCEFPSKTEIMDIDRRYPSLTSLNITLDGPSPTAQTIEDLVSCLHVLSKTPLAQRLKEFASDFHFVSHGGRDVDFSAILATQTFPSLRSLSLSTSLPYDLNKVIDEGTDEASDGDEWQSWSYGDRAHDDPQQSGVLGDIKQLKQTFEALREFSRSDVKQRKSALDIDIDGYNSYCYLSFSFEGGKVVSREIDHYSPGDLRWDWRRELLEEWQSDSENDSGSDSSDDKSEEEAGEHEVAGTEVSEETI